MKFLYGINKNYVDITDKINNENIIKIYPENYRSVTYGDHIYGTVKHIKFINDIGEETIIDQDKMAYISKSSQKILTIFSPTLKLSQIHKNIKLEYGSIQEEYPEQLLTVMFLDENAKVLEIGSNIGRNSCIIASILNNDKNLVTLESDTDIIPKLEYNKYINNFNFNIENYALSTVPLIQREWNTKTFLKEIPQGWKEVNTINFNDLQIKYNMQFDTIILDCEGAFYQILLDMPECLENINTIIMENDYDNIDKKNYVDTVLEKYNFKSIFSMPGGWGPCKNNFYEVFTKNEFW